MKLKDCPFCGNKAYMTQIKSVANLAAYEIHLASCTICGANIEGVDKDRVGMSWNNRDNAFQMALKWPKQKIKRI